MEHKACFIATTYETTQAGVWGSRYDSSSRGIGRLDIFRDRWSQVVVYYRPGPIKSRESDLDDDQVIARSVMMPKVSGIPE